MPNIIYNRLKVTAPDRSLLLSLIGELDVTQVWGSDKTFTITDNFSVCTYPFDSAWFPPVEVYETLEKRVKNLDGVTLMATWYDEADEWNTRYRWLFDGQKYQVVETGLNPRIAAWIAEEGLENSQPTVGTVMDFDHCSRQNEIDNMLKRVLLAIQKHADEGGLIF